MDDLLSRAERAGNEGRIAQLTEEMRLPPLHRSAWPVWVKFLRLSRRRDWSDWGAPRLIKHTEIVAFQQLTRIRFAPWEIDLIEILDGVYMTVQSEAREG